MRYLAHVAQDSRMYQTRADRLGPYRRGERDLNRSGVENARRMQCLGGGEKSLFCRASFFKVFGMLDVWNLGPKITVKNGTDLTL